MRFFVDNNLSKGLARGMKAFGENVDHLQDHFAPDAPDIEWLEYIGKNKFYLITRDDMIRRNPAEIQAFRTYGVGAFFLGGKNRTRWELVQQIVGNWQRIKVLAESTNPPFAYRIPPSGRKVAKIEI